MNLDDMLEELRSSGIAADPSPAQIILPLFRLRDVIWRGDKEIARHHGLTWAEFETLAMLRYSPPHVFKPSDLYERLSITSGGLTKILKKLESDGHIGIVQNEEDARSHFVRLTIKGKRLAEKVIAHFEKANCLRFGSALDRREQAELSGLLRKLLASMDGGGRHEDQGPQLACSRRLK